MRSQTQVNYELQPRNSRTTLGWRRRLGILCLLLAATAITLPAQTLTTLANFDGTNGDEPLAPVVQGGDGNLYGTTSSGGANGSGTVFKVTSTGTLTTLYSFCAQTNCTDGATPDAGLVLATDGNFYGTTFQGGANTNDRLCVSPGCGTVFKITPGGTLTTLYNFCSLANCADGSVPIAGLVQGADGDFYGTASSGGVDGEEGTVFKITPSGKLTTLYSFCSQSRCTDGEVPEAPLVQGRDGNFYGTTWQGGVNLWGTVFKITPKGTLTTLYSFCAQGGAACTDGSDPLAPVVQARDGNFYGTTLSGGSVGYVSDGTVFKITPAGTLTTLHSFTGADGGVPRAGLVQATDGTLYGTTGGGAYEGGTIFKITLGGALTTLYNFCSQSGCSDGAYPEPGVFQATDGNLYGTTSGGGTDNDGTVFSLSVGLGPFVETLPTLGPAGAPVRILGTSLTGTTSVTFNGTAATFAVNPTGTAINTTVPSGATAGTVQVVTPGGTLSSNVPFRVRH